MRVIPSFVSTWKQISCYFLIFTLKLKELLSIKQANWRTNTISGILITWDNRSNNHWTKRTVMNRACLLNTQTLRIRKNYMLYMKLLQWIPFLAIKLQIYRQFTAGSRWNYCLIFTQNFTSKVIVLYFYSTRTLVKDHRSWPIEDTFIITHKFHTSFSEQDRE